MGFEKSDVKIDAAHELGCRLDDALEGSTKEFYRIEGSVASIQQSLRLIDVVSKEIDKDVDDGKFDLETAKLIKQYLEKTQVLLRGQHQAAESSKLTQSGKIQAMTIAVNIAKKYKDEEFNKSQLLRAAYARSKEAEIVVSQSSSVQQNESDQDENFRRTTGERPRSSIKARRLSTNVDDQQEIKEEDSVGNSIDSTGTEKTVEPRTKQKRQKN